MDFKITRHKFIPEPKYDGRYEALMVRWDYKGYRNINVLNGTYHQKEWIQTLHTKINECSNWLHTNLRDIDVFDVNTITTSTTGLMLFEEMPTFIYDPNNYGHDNHLGILSGRYVVSLDRQVEDDHIYLGTQEQPKLCKIFIDNLGL